MKHFYMPLKIVRIILTIYRIYTLSMLYTLSLNFSKMGIMVHQFYKLGNWDSENKDDLFKDTSSKEESFERGKVRLFMHFLDFTIISWLLRESVEEKRRGQTWVIQMSPKGNVLEPQLNGPSKTILQVLSSPEVFSQVPFWLGEHGTWFWGLVARKGTIGRLQ